MSTHFVPIPRGNTAQHTKMHDTRDAAGLTEESYAVPETEPGPLVSRGENTMRRVLLVNSQFKDVGIIRICVLTGHGFFLQGTDETSEHSIRSVLESV